MLRSTVILACAAALAACFAASSCLAQATNPENPAPFIEGVSSLYQGVSMGGVGGSNERGAPGSASAMSSVMAMGASEGAEIDRVRASMGGAQYKPQTVCGSDVNIGPAQPSTNPWVPSVTYANNTTVLTAGACAAQTEPTKAAQTSVTPTSK